MWRGDGIADLFLFALFFAILLRDWVWPTDTGILVISLLSAFLTYFGKGIQTTGSLAFLIPSAHNLVSVVACMSGYFLLFGWLYRRLWCLLDHETPMCADGTSEKWRLLPIWATLLALWMPYLVVLLPGSLPWDGAEQLVQGLGMVQLTNHHPILLNEVYAVLFEFGSAFGGLRGGVLVLSTVQVLVLSGCVAFACLWIVRMGAGRSVAVLAILFWGLLPVFPEFAMRVMKDVPSAALNLLFLTQVAVYALRTNKRTGGYGLLSLPALGTVSFLNCLLRNANAIMMLFGLIALVVQRFLFGDRRSAVRLTGTAAAVFMALTAWNIGVIPATGAVPGNSREALSLPLQQTARYLSEHSDDVTPHEREVLERATPYATLADVAASYEPTISDPVKAQFDFDSGEMGVLEYLRVWFAMGLRHPGTYLLSAAEGSLGYWYPFAHWGRLEAVATGDADELLRSDLLVSYGIDTQFIERYGGLDGRVFPDATDLLNQISNFLIELPVLELIFSPGTYTWIVLAILCYSLPRGRVGAVLAAPLLSKIAVCCLSPLAGSMRYALPVVLAIPLLVATAMLPCEDARAMDGNPGNDSAVEPQRESLN